MVSAPLGLDSGQVVEVVGGARGVLQLLDLSALGRAFHGAHDGGDLVGVVCAGGAAPNRTPAVHRAQSRTRRLAAGAGGAAGGEAFA